MDQFEFINVCPAGFLISKTLTLRLTSGVGLIILCKRDSTKSRSAAVERKRSASCLSFQKNVLPAFAGLLVSKSTPSEVKNRRAYTCKSEFAAFETRPDTL